MSNYRNPITFWGLCFRAYVEFYRSSLRGSGVLPEVFLSILHSQQRLSLSLYVYPAEEVEARAWGQSVSHLKYARYTKTSHSSA